MRHERGDDEAGETIWAPAEAHSAEHSLQDSVMINAREHLREKQRMLRDAECIIRLL